MVSRTLWNLLEHELDFTTLSQSGYQSYHQDEHVCNVLLCGVDMMDIAGAMSDPHDTFFIVALNDPVKELSHVPKTFDAWIDINKLGTLPTLLNAYEPYIHRKEKQRLTRMALQNFMVSSELHKSNLEAVRGVIRASSQEIESIFDSRVKDLKIVQEDTRSSLEKLATLMEHIKEEGHPLAQEITALTNDIEKKTESTMKAMRAFIVVLQCEDRLTQMLDGIAKIIDHDIKETQNHGLYVPLDKEAPIKASLAEFYTIQEQRDFAMGIENALTPCNEPEDDGFILF